MGRRVLVELPPVAGRGRGGRCPGPIDARASGCARRGGGLLYSGACVARSECIGAAGVLAQRVCRARAAAAAIFPAFFRPSPPSVASAQQPPRPSEANGTPRRARRTMPPRGGSPAELAAPDLQSRSTPTVASGDDGNGMGRCVGQASGTTHRPSSWRRQWCPVLRTHRSREGFDTRPNYHARPTNFF